MNAIAPGVVREDPTLPDLGAAAMAGTPYGRILFPDTIAGAAVYLASDHADEAKGAPRRATRVLFVSLIAVGGGASILEVALTPMRRLLVQLFNRANH